MHIVSSQTKDHSKQNENLTPHLPFITGAVAFSSAVHVLDPILEGYNNREDPPPHIPTEK